MVKIITLAVASAAAILGISTAAAQTPDPAQSRPAGRTGPEVLEEIVVTGTISSAQRRVDTGFSITTANAEQIAEAAPTSTADLLKIVPGLSVEANGGTSGANVFVRGLPSSGDAPFLTVEVNGAPVFPQPTLFFLEGTTLFRVDDMVQRVEALRGGPSPVLSSGQPGVTVNFIQRQGGDKLEGSARATYGSEGMYRVDSWVSGPINEGLRYAIGGFYRTSDGLRNTQFSADHGGQISATLTADLSDVGTVMFYARYTDDQNAFYQGVPLFRQNGRIQAVPGFDPQSDTLLGNDLRYFEREVGIGANPPTRSFDLADGRGVNLFSGGVNADLRLGDWSLSNNFTFMTGTGTTIALFNGLAPQTMAAFIASQVTRINNPGTNAKGIALLAQQGPATSGVATYTMTGQAVDPNQLVMGAGFWTAFKKLNSFSDELRLSRELFKGNTLTFGAYYARYSSDDDISIGNNRLITARNNATPVDLTLNDGVIITKKGFYSTSGVPIHVVNSAENSAVFMFDEWKLTDAWRIDAGARIEKETIDALNESSTANTDLDGRLQTAYDTFTNQLNGTYTPLSFADTQTSWTVGLTYLLTSDFSVFARVNSGVTFPQFDNLRSGQTAVTQIDQYEVGLKAVSNRFAAYLTIFGNEFSGLSVSRTVLDVNGAPVVISGIAGTKAYGAELEGEFRFTDAFSLTGQLTYQHAQYQDYLLNAVTGIDNTGHQVARQPAWRVSVAPAYEAELGIGSFKASATYNYVDRRFSDPENVQPLPAYHTIDAGLSLTMKNRVTLRLTGDNITDEFGLTEGNPQTVGSGANGGYFLARPIFGRHWTFSAAYSF